MGLYQKTILMEPKKHAKQAQRFVKVNLTPNLPAGYRNLEQMSFLKIKYGSTTIMKYITAVKPLLNTIMAS